MTSDIGFALLLSALAGLSTTIGSLLGLFVRQPGPRFNCSWSASATCAGYGLNRVGTFLLKLVTVAK